MTTSTQSSERKAHSPQFTVGSIFAVKNQDKYKCYEPNKSKKFSNHIEKEYCDTALSDLSKINDSTLDIRYFARRNCNQFCNEFTCVKHNNLTVRVREDESAWASYQVTV